MSDFLSAGRLEEHPFAELSGSIFREARTGELQLESENRRRSVWFLGGNPVAVVSSDPLDHLAQFLLEHGKIGGDEAQRLADLPETREALAAAEFVPKDVLNWGVKSRFVNLCYDLFRWDEGEYTFREGEPPRELFLLKVPAHSLIFKGVGLLGQAAVLNAVPDDAACGAGTVPAAEARYLTPEALQLAAQCAPGRTVADVIGGGSADPDQTRRLLYALSCLGIVAFTRGPEAVEAPADDGFGFSLDNEEPGDDASAAAGFSPEAAALPAADHQSADFNLDLPPLSAGNESPELPDVDFESPDPAQQHGSYDFDSTLGSGSFGSFASEANGELHDEASSDEGPHGAGAAAGRPGRRFHVPRIVGVVLGAAAALGIIGVAGWWWMSGSEPPPPPVKPPVKSAAAPAPGAPPEPTPAPVAPAPPPGAPLEPTPSPAGAPAPAATAPSPAPPAQTATPAPALRPSPPSSVPAAPVDGDERQRNAQAILRAGDLDGAAAVGESLLADRRRGFTVQLLTACQSATVQDALRAIPGHNLYLISKKVDGRVCYRICVGTFDSREAAGSALSGLPPVYRSGGAAVRPVADVLIRDR